jgi:ubiquinone/menaquinone biosynthesis C-methylase UbiE
MSCYLPRIVLAIVLVGILVTQCRKPWGWLGRRVARSMNITHSRLTDWGLGHVAVEKDHTILDVGCGGGETVHKLAALARDGKVYGIDYSKASVAASQSRNAQLIQAGRIAIAHGSVSHLPFTGPTFDLVTAVETHYYWPDLSSDMREILRVLKPGGRLVIIAEAYKGRRFDLLYRPIMKVLGAKKIPHCGGARPVPFGGRLFRR